MNYGHLTSPTVYKTINQFSSFGCIPQRQQVNQKKYISTVNPALTQQQPV